MSRLTCLSLFAALFMGHALAQTPLTDLLYGHIEIHADYELPPASSNVNTGWKLNVSYNKNDDFNDRTQIVRMDPETTVIVASPRTTQQTNGNAITITTAVSRLGTVGSPLWFFPQANVLGTPFLGARAVMDPGIFQVFFMGNYTASATGSIGLRLVSMTGTGPAAGGRFGLWESDGSTLLWYLDTSNGITSADSIPTLPPNAHSHFNWGFTKPGTYNLTIEASGKTNPGLSRHANKLTSAQKTFRFSIPFSSRLQAQATIRFGHNATSERWHSLLEDSTNAVAYVPTQGFLEASTTATSPVTTTLSGAVRQMPLTFTTAGSSVANIVGLDPALASAGLPTGILQSDQLIFTLTSHSGPGVFALLNSAGTAVLMNTADGITSADSFTLTGAAALSTIAAFTQTGIHRVTGTLSGLPVGGGTVRVSEPFTLVFGSGVTANHSYATWRDSFERTHGLAANTLASASADYDKDGLVNGVEFLLFWHGADPVRPGGHTLPMCDRIGTAANFDFLRDTYKDAIMEGSYEINAATSTDLINWTVRSPRVIGLPLESYETGAEAGNAHGRIMQRRLRILTDPGERRFFRFQPTFR
jgi:surface-anchored protein